MPIEALIEALRIGVHHATSLSNYSQIISSGKIRFNDGSLPFSFENSGRCNCFDLKAVSLFDFESPSSECIFDDITRMKWESVLFRHNPSILLGFRRDELPGEIIYYGKAKRLCGLGGIIPGIEICHVGDIPLAAVRWTIVAERSYAFRVYEGCDIGDLS